MLFGLLFWVGSSDASVERIVTSHIGHLRVLELDEGYAQYTVDNNRWHWMCPAMWGGGASAAAGKTGGSNPGETWFATEGGAYLLKDGLSDDIQPVPTAPTWTRIAELPFDPAQVHFASGDDLPNGTAVLETVGRFLVVEDDGSFTLWELTDQGVAQTGQTGSVADAIVQGGQIFSVQTNEDRGTPTLFRNSSLDDLGMVYVVWELDETWTVERYTGQGVEETAVLTSPVDGVSSQFTLTDDILLSAGEILTVQGGDPEIFGKAFPSGSTCLVPTDIGPIGCFGTELRILDNPGVDSQGNVDIEAVQFTLQDLFPPRKQLLTDDTKTTCLAEWEAYATRKGLPVSRGCSCSSAGRGEALGLLAWLPWLLWFRRRS